jgi:hypothetical protein
MAIDFKVLGEPPDGSSDALMINWDFVPPQPPINGD